jgi:hypothetical protein
MLTVNVYRRFGGITLRTLLLLHAFLLDSLTYRPLNIAAAILQIVGNFCHTSSSKAYGLVYLFIKKYYPIEQNELPLLSFPL